ncbi:hypothetical protein [Streptomyces sp. NPDC058486]|uniref:hypothetical protein n=1 Tax=unclassified Streptomyces TaxID=2593676 RepID=UPI0036475D00
MDFVYASLRRRARVHAGPTGEVAEALDALWAHATPEDGLEHASGRSEQDRVDLLMCLLTLDRSAPGFRSPVHRASSLLRRCHEASPLMRGRYLPPGDKM